MNDQRGKCTTCAMFQEFLGYWDGEVLGVFEFEGERVALPAGAVSDGQFGIGHRWNDDRLGMTPEHVLTEDEVAEGKRQAAGLLYRHSTCDVRRARVVLLLGGRRVPGARRLRGRLADPILRKLSRHAAYLDLQPSGDLALLAYYRRVVVEPDVVEQHLQKYVRHADQIVVLLRLEEWILRLPRHLVLFSTIRPFY